MKNSPHFCGPEKSPAGKRACRVVLVDDDALFRHGLKRTLLDRGELKVSGEAADGLEFLEWLGSAGTTPDLAILDITMPRLGGIEAAARAKRIRPGMKVLILSMHREWEYVQAALAAGADGYVLKADADLELFAAIEKIMRGGTYISPLLAEGDDSV